MTFTYGGNLTTSALDWCRFLIGDTDLEDKENQLLTDEELLALIGTETDFNALYGAAADAAEAIATKFRKYPATRIGGLVNIDARDIVSQYTELADYLRTHIPGEVAIVAGGTDKCKAFHADKWEDTYY